MFHEFLIVLIIYMILNFENYVLVSINIVRIENLDTNDFLFVFCY